MLGSFLISDALALYRFLFPRSRVQNRFRFYHNTNCRKSMQCVFCRVEGPTWSSRYPKTKRAEHWEAEHSCNPLGGVLKQASDVFGKRPCYWKLL